MNRREFVALAASIGASPVPGTWVSSACSAFVVECGRLAQCAHWKGGAARGTRRSGTLPAPAWQRSLFTAVDSRRFGSVCRGEVY